MIKLCNNVNLESQKVVYDNNNLYFCVAKYEQKSIQRCFNNVILNSAVYIKEIDKYNLFNLNLQ